MKNFKTLFFYELKKILQRKSTWITMGALLIFLLFMECGGYLASVYSGSEFAENIKIGKQDVKHISGQTIDEELLREFQEAHITFGAEETTSAAHKENIVPYKNLFYVLKFFAPNIDIYYITAEELYQARDAYVQEVWDEYRLSDAEIRYWEQKEEKLERPFVYQYSEAFKNLTIYDGVYIDCLLLTFFIAICASVIFYEEHSRRTDQLVLCSRFGRKETYFVRICAGSLVSFCAAFLLELVSAASNFIIYGTDGASAMIQLWVSDYSYSLTLGEIFLIITGLLFLISVFVTIFTMVLSELTHSSIGSMAVVIAILFLARLIEIPHKYRLISQIWEYLPINQIKNGGMFDPRLVPFFGGHLTSWQFAPILYVLLGLIFIFIGKRAYCKYQVNGR